MDFLKQYQDIINKAIYENQFNEHPQELYDPINYILAIGGKRLRAIMLLMGCDAFHGNIQKAIKPALAIEFFHNFTLIHDDIMDNASIRRGRPTIHALHGINRGILSGDTLFIKSYQFFEDLEPILFKKCIQLFSKTGALLCKGQQMDINFETNNSICYDDYIKMITYKTGILSATALKLGAIIGDATSQNARALYQFGKYIGIAFQIMDDYLDVFGKEEFGKKYAGDIYENKKTILYISAMKNASEKDKKNLNYWYSKKTEDKEKIEYIKNIFIKTKAEEEALQLVKKYNELGQNFLYETNICEDKKQNFINFANSLLLRTI